MSWLTSFLTSAEKAGDLGLILSLKLHIRFAMSDPHTACAALRVHAATDRLASLFLALGRNARVASLASRLLVILHIPFAIPRC